MGWEKLGLVFCPHQNFEWMQTHASYPVAEYLREDIFRIYFSTRNNNNVSSIGYVDVDINRPKKILNLSTQPVLSSGELGAFDNDGASLACISHTHDQQYLYYLGWNLCKSFPWNNSIGLAISKKSKSQFERYSKAPIMGRSDSDPFSMSYPWVMQDEGKWKMWYGSHLNWGNPGDKEICYHVIKYAESNDGIHWIRNNIIAVPFDKSKGEYAISRPCVIKEDGVYKMWYSFRGESYRIGYAESRNGIEWLRKDSEVRINPSDSGWDAESIEYPFVFKHKQETLMLYNGNGYGKTGFGLAVWRGQNVL